MSIGARLLSAILGVLVLGLLGLAYWTNELSRTALTASILSQQEMTARGAAQAINAELGAYLYAVRTAAADSEIINALRNPDDTKTVDEACATMTALRDAMNNVTVAGVLDANGILAMGSEKENVGKQNLSERRYFKNAMQGQTVISQAALSSRTGKPSFFVATPVRVDGVVRGVVFATVDLAALSEVFIAPLRIGKRGYAFMSEVPGTTLAHPETKRLFENTSGFDWIKTMMQRKNGSMEYAFGDKERVAGFAEVPLTGWIVSMAAEQDDVLSEVTEIRNAIFTASLIMLVIVASVVIWVVRDITRGLHRAVVFAENIAAGRLDHDLHTARKDELGTLGRALQTMLERLRSMIAATEEKTREAESAAQKAQVATDEAKSAHAAAENARREGLLEAAKTLEGIVGRLSSSASSLAAEISAASKGTEVQRERAAETATAMEEMNATVLEVAHNAAAASEASERTRAEAVRGEETVKSVVGAIADVHHLAGTMGASLKDLGEHADGIGRVLAVISDIADQTNLLALNAAIEAARAGEAGRGFAVVADEVRKLAEKTMTATKEVADAVGAIQTGTRQAIALMDDAGEAVQRSNTLAGTAGDALQSIVKLVEGSSDQVRAIAAASEEQSATSEQINRGTEEINRIATETANSASGSAKSVNELSQMTQELTALIERFKKS